MTYIPEKFKKQVYEFNAEDGVNYKFDASVAIVLTGGRVDGYVSLAESGFTEEVVQKMYPDLNKDYAVSAEVNLLKPIIVVTVDDDTNIIIDGWHRVWKALSAKQDILPFTLLTTDEYNLVLLERTEE